MSQVLLTLCFLSVLAHTDFSFHSFLVYICSGSFIFSLSCDLEGKIMYIATVSKFGISYENLIFLNLLTYRNVSFWKCIPNCA